MAPSLVDLLVARCREFSSAPVLVGSDDEIVTYAQLFERAARVAGGLRGAGVSRGDRVGLQLPNCVNWVVAYWAIHLAGGVVVTLSSRSTPPEVDHIVADCEVKVVLDDPGRLTEGAPFVIEGQGEDSIASIFYTSGTTGRPKGVIIRHRNAIQNAENQRRMYAAALGDSPLRSIIAVPLSHITGCNSLMLSTVNYGGTSIIRSGFTVESFIEAAVEHRATALVGVPTMYWRIIRDPAFSPAALAHVKSISYGGAPTPPRLVEDIRAAFGEAALQNGFGSTECTGLHTALPNEYALSHSSSVGIAMPVCDIKVDDPDVHGVGELVVRGPNVTTGYWNRPDATRDAFTVDGWLRMGDLGRIDGDGFVYVVDRIKDMISRGGEKVFSGEVEDVLAAAPGVWEVAVVGVPDDELGERVGALIVAEPGTALDTAAVIEHAQHHLLGYKIPELVIAMTEPLPRNSAGKIVKSQLRQSIDWREVPIYRRGPVTRP
ncbi:class I adenylate-forming enzyme family protein [Fodinicola feengrottensis]|uniref:class I adenylate-forming enzyme family protein n=1 Tax=Fodinicola feengrottensis TaxID=435914 RepID=UPI0031DC0A85